MTEGLGPLSHEERLREPGLLRLRKKKLGGILSMSINTWGWKIGSQTSLSAVHLTGNGYKSKHKKLHLNTWKLFLTVRMVKHQHRLPREVCQVSILGDFSKPAWAWLWETCSRWSCSAWAGGWTWWSQNDGPFQPQQIGDSFILHREFLCSQP